MRLWLFSSSVKSFFKRACAAIQWSWVLIGPFIFFHTSCARTAKALARLRICAGSPEPSLVLRSGETAHMRRLAWAFAGRLFDKYHNLMSWLICLLRWLRFCFIQKQRSAGQGCVDITLTVILKHVSVTRGISGTFRRPGDVMVNLHFLLLLVVVVVAVCI